MARKEHKLHFVENFGLSGAAAIISKTAAAPIERIKLLVQNQDEMLKTGRLETPYKGIIDCTSRTYRAEGFLSFWRGGLSFMLIRNCTCCPEVSNYSSSFPISHISSLMLCAMFFLPIR